jgi:hypothetical protein
MYCDLVSATRENNESICSCGSPLRLFSAPQVTYASRIDDTACWSASLTLAQYRAFVSPSSSVASPFFAAAPMPQAAKFGPGLIVQKLHHKQTDGDGNLSVSASAFADTMGKSSGIRVILHKGKKTLEEVRSSVSSAPFPPMHIRLIRDANSNCF